MKYILEWSPDDQKLGLKITANDGTQLQVVPRVISLKDLARHLKRSRRHLYRYLKKGWLKPLVKFSGEYFFDEAVLTTLPSHSSRMTALPRRFARLFPEYDLDTLTISRDGHLIMSRILERGNSEDLDWLTQHYSLAERKKFLREDGERTLSPRTLNFWTWLLEGKRISSPTSWRRKGQPLGGRA